jgi:hypothetical protein
MQLLTQELLDRFRSTGDQAEAKDPLVIAKFFNPAGAGTWFATAYDSETRIFYGFVSIFGDHNDEWGSFSLEELQSYRGPLGLGIERDRFFQPKRASEIDIIRKSLL